MTRYRALGVLLLLLPIAGICSARPASILSTLNNNLFSDTLEVNGYIAKGKSYAKLEYDSAFNSFSRALRLSEQIHFQRGTIISLMNLGALTKNKGAYDQALHYYKRAIVPGSQFEELVSTTYNNLGNTYMKLGLFDSALLSLQKSLEIKIRRNDKEGIVNSYISLGNFHAARREFKAAGNYFKKGLSIEKGLSNNSRLAKLYKNLGNVYFELDLTDSAELLYQNALRLQENASNDVVDLGGLYLNLGNIHQRRGNLSSALALYEKSLAMNEKAGDPYRMVNSLQNIGNIHDQRKEYSRAISYYQQALNKAKLINAADQEKALLFCLSESYEKSANYMLALTYYKKADTISETLYNNEKVAQLAEMQTKFETGQKEKELVQQKAISEKNIYERNTFIAISFLLLLLVGAFLFIYLKIKSANRILTSQKALIEKREYEKGILLRELHHRTKNNLQLVSSLLSLQAHQLKDKEAAHAVKEGQTRVEAMALIHRDLYKRENVTRVNLKTYLENMVSNLISTYNFSKSSIIVSIDVESIELEADLAIPLGLIANELLSNAFKHAFKHQDLPELLIVAKEMSENELHLLIRDNGPGIESSLPKDTTFGMKIIHSLINQLGGVISIENIAGCVVTVIVPLKKEALIEA